MKRLVAVLLLAVASLSACEPTDNYAAKVNGTEISVQSIEDELHAITSNPRYSSLLNQQLGGATGGLQPGGENTVNAQYTAQVVYNRILVALIYEAVEKEKVDVTPEYKAQSEFAVRNDLQDAELWDSLPASYRSYLVDRQAALSAVLASRNTEAAQRAKFEKDSAKYTDYCIRHILVKTQDEADQIRGRILGGESFAEVAKKESIDNDGGGGGSAALGGELACVTCQELEGFVAPFRDAALALKQNELSQPVQTNFGFHLVEITSIKQQTFENVQSQISDELSAASTFFVEVVAAAKITVNPRFGDFVPGDPAQGTTPQVVPHTPAALSPPSTAPEPGGPSLGGTGRTGSGAGQPDTSGQTEAVPPDTSGHTAH